MQTGTVESCSFCGKHKEVVQKLIVSESVAICNECVDLCQGLLQDQPPPIKFSHDSRDPQEIKSFLDQYVIGQDSAKIALAVAVVNHYKRINRLPDAPEINKANILMLGPTGSGKTLLARSIARYLDVPFAITDATSVTEAGYVGDDVETLISRLYSNSGYDLERTQRGIIFVDEIDKISRRSESSSITRDVSGEGVQQALLKLVEGTTCRVPPQAGRKHPSGEIIEIDTTNILFIAGGAFVGLDDIMTRREQGTNIGFSSTITSKKNSNLTNVTANDLVKFGMIPEFVGRFPVTVTLLPLTSQDLMMILTQVKHNLCEQYKWYLQQDDIDLDFSNEALCAIVDRAIKSGTGARALHGEIERVMMPHMYAARDYNRRELKHLKIDLELVNNPTVLMCT
jgi:ATP-dependent Clp protease ATP-binding subunit ClpX